MNRSHIEITSGIVSSSVTESSDGQRHNFGEIGTRRFFVDLVVTGGAA